MIQGVREFKKLKTKFISIYNYLLSKYNGQKVITNLILTSKATLTLKLIEIEKKTLPFVPTLVLYQER